LPNLNAFQWDGTPNASLAEAFLVSKAVGGCSERIVGVYRWWLERLRTTVGGDISRLHSPTPTRFFASPRERGVSASTVHQAYRTLKTFFRWLLSTGAVKRDPLMGVSIRTAVALPQVLDEILAFIKELKVRHASMKLALGRGEVTNIASITKQLVEMGCRID
jgi:site-specific recombinase XerD